MTIKEACELVLQSTQINTKNKILFLDMGKPIKIIEIIKKIFLIVKKPNQKLKLSISVINIMKKFQKSFH